MGLHSLSATVFAVLVLAACRTPVPLDDPARSAQLKGFSLKPAVGQIYVCRDGRNYGKRVHTSVEIDEKPIGEVSQSIFLYTEVAPGTHELVAKSPEHDSRITFEIAAGEQKFFQTWLSIGAFSLWAIAEEIDAAAGKTCVTEGNLAVSPNRN